MDFQVSHLLHLLLTPQNSNHYLIFYLFLVLTQTIISLRILVLNTKSHQSNLQILNPHKISQLWLVQINNLPLPIIYQLIAIQYLFLFHLFKIILSQDKAGLFNRYWIILTDQPKSYKYQISLTNLSNLSNIFNPSHKINQFNLSNIFNPSHKINQFNLSNIFNPSHKINQFSNN